MEVAFHLWHGAPVTGLLRTQVDVVPEGDKLVVVAVKKAAVFSNWLGLQSVIRKQAEGRDEVVVDLSRTWLVDHSVMEKLHEMERQFSEQGKQLSVIGLEAHEPRSAHPHAARLLRVRG